jgi:hypothetical protein
MALLAKVRLGKDADLFFVLNDQDLCHETSLTPLTAELSLDNTTDRSPQWGAADCGKYRKAAGESWRKVPNHFTCESMKKLSLAIATVFALLSIAGCAQYVGKGKAPPPVVTKG